MRVPRVAEPRANAGVKPTVVLYASQTNLCFGPSVLYLFQDSLPRATVHSLNYNQAPRFGNLSELLVLKVDCTAKVGMKHHCLGSTDV